MLLDPCCETDPPLLWFDEDGKLTPHPHLCGAQGTFLYERVTTSITLYHLDPHKIVDRRQQLYQTIKRKLAQAEEKLRRLREHADMTAQQALAEDVREFKEFMAPEQRPRSPRRPLGLDDSPGRSESRHHEGLKRESDLAILSQHAYKGEGLKKEVAVGTVIHEKPQGNDDRHQRWDRLERADLFAPYGDLHAQDLAQRQAAQVLEVPRSTLQAWRAYQEPLDACPAVVAFFHSVPGLALLHRLVLA
jgi:hypothetical protein